ncbi:MAG: efflux RND transporter periplasmic adaptor subunit [Paracoccaceae bacterium]|nr:efflux RND transporter periplasmic adaptor subunit [Paracoccaceae bacterium]
MIRLTLGLILLAAAASTALPRTDNGGSERGAADDYLTAVVETAVIRRTVVATGSLQAVTTVEVSSQLSGQIAQVEADFNDTVRAGDTLASLDRRGFEARVAQAEAEAQMARETVAILTATLEKAGGIADESATRRRVFAARIERAEVELRAAERAEARAERLAGKGTAAQAAVEDARSAREAAAAELRESQALADAHEHLVASSEAGRREAEAELANARAALPLREAALALARLDLERSAIRAPTDGIIVGRNVEPGQTVAVSLDAPVLFTIVGDLAAMEIHAAIDETDIGEIAAGQIAEFTVDAYPGRRFQARVTQIRKAARLIQGVVTYTVVLETENSEGLLLPGMTSTVRIAVEEAGPGPAVPLAALRFAPSGLAEPGTVWVRESTGIAPRKVTLGPDNGTRIAVIGGDLAAGDTVVTGRLPSTDRRRLFGIRY